MIPHFYSVFTFLLIAPELAAETYLDLKRKTNSTIRGTRGNLNNHYRWLDQERKAKDDFASIALQSYKGCRRNNKERPQTCFPRDPKIFLSRPDCQNECSSGVHLAPGKDAARSMTVSFAVDFTCGMQKVKDAFVIIGTDPSDLRRPGIAEMVVKQYNSTACLAEDPHECIAKTSHSCTPSHFDLYVSDNFVHFTAYNLSPGTTYYYTTFPPPCSHDSEVLDDTSIIGDDGERIFKFKTAPDYSGAVVTFAVLADTEKTPDADITFQTLHETSHHIDAIIIPGDMVYSNRDQRIWDNWLKDYEALFGSKPLIVAAGNHDQDTDCCDWSTFKGYENRFQMPQIRDPHMRPSCQATSPSSIHNYGAYDFGNAFYSVIFGPVHVIVLNTYTEIGTDSPQYDWFHDELRGVDRKKTPWLFVVAHANIYGVFKRHKDEVPQVQMKQSLERLFIKHNVNFFFSGHDHAYSRTLPVAKGKKRKHAPIYITIGNTGRLHDDGISKEEPWLASYNYWSLGFGTISVLNETHALWETSFHQRGSYEKIPGTDHAYIENSLHFSSFDTH